MEEKAGIPLAEPSTSTADSNDLAVPPSVDLVMKVLDGEINRLETIYRRPGWTPWVLTGSLCGVGWLILQQDASHVSVLATLILLLAWRALGRMVTALSRTLSFLSQRGEPRFAPVRTLLANGREAILLDVALSLTEGGLLLFLRSRLGALHTLPIAILCLLNGVAALSLLGLSYSQLKAGSPQKVHAIWVVPSTVVNTLLLVGVSRWTLTNIATVSTVELRCSLLLVAGLHLLNMLLAGREPAPAIDSLHYLRRELAFGRVKPADAVRQIDDALSGVRLDEFLQEQLEHLLPTIEDMDRKIKEASKERTSSSMRAARSKLAELSGKRDRLRGLLLGMGFSRSGQQVRQLFDRIDEAIKDARRRISDIEPE